MTTVQDKTLDFYNHNSAAYKERTDSIDLGDHYNKVLDHLGESRGHLLDLGCGPGRDSKYFLTQGFSVTSLDGSKAMVDLVSNFNSNTRLLDFELLDYFDKFDVVWSSAALLHVEKTQIRSVLRRVRDSLKVGGIFYLSLKEGTEDFVDDQGRYFSTYQKKEISSIIESIAGLRIEEIWVKESLTSKVGEKQMWLGAIVRRVKNQPLYRRFLDLTKQRGFELDIVSSSVLKTIEAMIDCHGYGLIEESRRIKFFLAGGFVKSLYMQEKNKIVRDKIPVITSDRKLGFKRVGRSDALSNLLLDKLYEELSEWKAEASLEEAADVMEIFDRLLEDAIDHSKLVLKY